MIFIGSVELGQKIIAQNIALLGHYAMCWGTKNHLSLERNQYLRHRFGCDVTVSVRSIYPLS